MAKPPAHRFLLPAVLSLLLSTGTPGAPDAANAGYRESPVSLPTAGGPARESTLFLWYPTDDAARDFNYRFQLGCVAREARVRPGRHPLVLFSHGYLGSGDQVAFLTEALARAGYIVAAVNHADSLAVRRPGQRMAPPKFGDARSWDENKFHDRGTDIKAMLDHLLGLDRDASSFLQGRIREDAVGMMGHSLGGYTALALAGAWPSWRESRLRAALLLSPYAIPFSGRLAPGAVRIPTMLQGGTRDFAITPFLDPIYENLPAPKYFLVLAGQTHFAWTNFLSLGRSTTAALAEPGPARCIADYSVAFFDKVLRGREEALLQGKKDGLASYKFEPK